MTKRFIAATAALCLAAGCASQSTEELGGQKSATLSKMDNMYFRDAAQSDMTEIQTSDMALQTSTNDQVKQFAQHMRNQHMQISAQAKAVGHGQGCDPADDVGREARGAGQVAAGQDRVGTSTRRSSTCRSMPTKTRST